MRLEHSIQINPFPILLSIGTLKKPKLREIFDTSSGMSFEKFEQYELFLKMTPEYFYTKLKKDDGGIELWNSFTEKKQNEIKLYDILTEDKNLCDIYVEIFNFFFVENVVFKENLFVLLKKGANDLSVDNVQGVIHSETFDTILDIICQICCINNEKKSSDTLPFKNKLAKKLYERMQKAQSSEKKNVENMNLTIPNIISSVSAKHPSINYINIWDLTIFQLLDNFNRMQVNSMYEINSTRISVWGDEKKTFDAALWYKNHYDTK